jgi:hypothetical protein
MSTDDLEQKLASARKHVVEVFKKGSPEDSRKAHRIVLQLERKLAASKGEEHAIPLEFPVMWETGAPMPHLVRNDYNCFLTFLAEEHYAALAESNGTQDEMGETLALVEFVHCISAKLGSPGDEVFDGHHLSGKGIELYSAQEIVNSRWLEELENINRVHSNYVSARWKNLHHYLLWFHDTTFECIAESFKVQIYVESMATMLQRMCKRLSSNN